MKENRGQILGRFPRHLRELELVVVQRPGGLARGLRAGWPDLGGRTVGERRAAQADGRAAVEHRPEQRRNTFRRMLAITERDDPSTTCHQTATFTAKRRDYKWRPAQSFVVDFRASN
jgi:peptide/nickel transport system substrate-binding protein